MRFLIDECLSHTLVDIANSCGCEAHHVTRLDRGGTEDRHLIPLILNGDFTLVTNNADDFRRLYGKVALHAGLILFIGQMNRPMQQRVFRDFLPRISDVDLINTLVEVRLDNDTVRTSFHAIGSHC